MSIYQRKDRMTWQLDVTWPDETRTRKVMPNYAVAKRIWEEIRVACALEDSHWQGVRSKYRLDNVKRMAKTLAPSIPEMAKIYYDGYCKLNNRSHESKKRWLNTITSNMPAIPMDKITARDVDQYIKNRQSSNISNNTVNVELTTLKHMYKWAVSRGYIDRNPVECVSRLKKVEYVGERPEERVINDILSNISNDNRPVFQFIRETGCRHGEAKNLEWHRVDMEKRIVNFVRTKTDKARSVPLTDGAMAALEAMPKTSQYVFAHAHTGRPWTDANMTYIWRMARRQVVRSDGENAHPTQLRIHDLRHAYAIKLAEAGCPMHFISEVLGHHSIDFTRKYYAKFSPESAINTVMQFLNDIGVKNTHLRDTTKIRRAA